MAACTFAWVNISDPVMAKVRACLQAFTMVEEMGLQDIIMEGDVFTIICKLNSFEEDKSNIRSLIKEIKRRTPKFRSLSFMHVPRKANKVAHGMAVEGRQYENPQYWIEDASQAVKGLVDHDRGSINDGG
ncbi:hypothetical protein J1N35_006990 [Gossypium stocksii]|uniref:RNase H type-1 domain-containing protein n=1 Tax=Gossypium stocksii TaxID=47602 RepID=A0A9D3W6U6_9ROSI|nr:hypothetical protein J1N35_006990 [Gossypium stocksii]